MSRGYERVQAKQSEHTRIVTYTIAAANRDPNKPFPSLHDFWPLPSDQAEIEQEKIDAEELKTRLMERYRKAFPNHFKAQA